MGIVHIPLLLQDVFSWFLLPGLRNIIQSYKVERWAQTGAGLMCSHLATTYLMDLLVQARSRSLPTGYLSWNDAIRALER